MAATEFKLTCDVARVLKLARVLFTHVANECPSKRRAHFNSAMGVSAGVPDFLVFEVPPLAIELKSSKGRVTPSQAGWMAALEARGWRVAVCRSVAEVVDLIRDVYGDVF